MLTGFNAYSSFQLPFSFKNYRKNKPARIKTCQGGIVTDPVKMPELLSRKCVFICILITTVFTTRSLGQAPPSNFSSVTVSSSWNQAVGLTFSKSGDQMFVWEKAGKVWVVENNVKSLLIDISPEVGNWNDFGLLGFALNPDFDINGYFYLLYTVDRHHLLNFGTPAYSATTNEYLNATIGRLTRYTATKKTNGYDVNTASRKILIGSTKSNGIPSIYKSHGVGTVMFGADGTLLLSAGDGASFISHDGGSDTVTYYARALADGIITPQENVGAFRSQLLESYDGKILRIDPETGDGIPGNPFYESNNPNSVRSKVWALGFRNPFRMVLKPNSGSANVADANPGTIYVGDVGYGTWEEVNVVSKPGQNFGWPLYEGLTPESGYTDLVTYNQFAANPLFGLNNCTQPYFYFQDLLKQATASGTATYANPCDLAQVIPGTVNTFMHTRPLIDFKHVTGPARTGIFNGETADVINIGSPGSPVSGSQFSGNAAIAGCFYSHDDFPAEYKNSLFFGDYGAQWIKSLAVDGNDKPVAVTGFIDSGSIVVDMAIHPTLGGLYYVNYPSQIKKVLYTNQLPVAVATSDKKFGPSPLSVQFSGSNSRDPDGHQLSYLWNFGDGTTSTLINPYHIFVTDTITPYNVTLTVTDSLGSTAQDSLLVSLNNTPPQVSIVSPADSSLYPMNADTTYTLQATVTDNEHSSGQLSYGWAVFLHHDNHEHPEPIDTARQTSVVISPLGCGSATYYYRIALTVTDAGGLATTKEVRLYPNCSGVIINPVNTAPILNSIGAQTVTTGETLSFTASATDADHGQQMTYSLLNAPQGTSINPASGFFSWTPAQAGTFTLIVKVTDNGSPAKSAQEQITITVSNPIVVNNAPVLIPIGNKTATAAQPLTFTATASDADPGQVITFSLVSGAPAGASINAASGVFSWTPVQGGSYIITVRVTDNGSPALTDEEQIIIIVSDGIINRLNPIADAYVRDGSFGGTNNGTNPFLQVKGTAVIGFMRSAFLKFSLADVNHVSAATLRIYGSNTDDTTSTTVSVYGVNNDAWTETGITSDNGPAALTPALGSVDVGNVAKYYDIDVTAFVNTQFAADKVVSFYIKDAGNKFKSLLFYSRENTQNKPQLVVENGINDFIPPVINLQFNGTSNAPNTYLNQVEVVVNASDSGGSGLASTQYSLNRAPFQNYGSSFIINTIGSYTITAKAIDGKGNTTSTSEITFNVVAPTVTQTLSPVADAYVRDGSYGGSNYGTIPFLQVKGTAVSGFMRSSFLKFSISAITSVGTAKLRLYGNNTDDSTIATMSVYGVTNDSWAETGITSDNAPVALSPALGVVDVNNVAKYYEIDVSSFVNAQLAGDKVVTFYLKDAGNKFKSLQFYSKENTSNKPQLIIESGGTDLTPPVVNVQLNGNFNSFTTYNNQVEVVVNASDAGGSGLASTFYSLNRGAYQNYSSSFIINAPGNYTISAKAIDGKGNVTITSEMAFSIVASTVTQVVSPVADAYVRDGSYGSANYGTIPFLQVKGTAVSGFMRASYLKFPLSSINTVGTAKLRLYGNNTDDSTVTTMSVYGVNNDAWTETGITSDNAPVALTPALGTVDVNNVAKYYEIDVTNYVNSQLAGDKVATFYIKDAANKFKSLQFYSKENSSNKPQLLIEYMPTLITRRE